ncbi:MAG TPA: PspC domain-containing protein [Anaerolineae bacterium]|nr:PspC domain-containing protein [Anaerolineae bacterium]
MSESPKRLYRSRQERWLAGICGGIGHYFNLDPTLIRALFVLAGLVIGGGIIAYILLWIIIPLEPEAATLAEDDSASES